MSRKCQKTLAVFEIDLQRIQGEWCTIGDPSLLLLEATDHASAEALIRQDPMLRSGCVTWSLHGWISAVGDLNLA